MSWSQGGGWEESAVRDRRVRRVTAVTKPHQISQKHSKQLCGPFGGGFRRHYAQLHLYRGQKGAGYGRLGTRHNRHRRNDETRANRIKSDTAASTASHPQRPCKKRCQRVGKTPRKTHLFDSSQRRSERCWCGWRVGVHGELTGIWCKWRVDSAMLANTVTVSASTFRRRLFGVSVSVSVSKVRTGGMCGKCVCCCGTHKIRRHTRFFFCCVLFFTRCFLLFCVLLLLLLLLCVWFQAVFGMTTGTIAPVIAAPLPQFQCCAASNSAAPSTAAAKDVLPAPDAVVYSVGPMPVAGTMTDVEVSVRL